MRYTTVNSLGQVVKYINISPAAISIKDLPTGLYLVRFQDTDGVNHSLQIVLEN